MASEGVGADAGDVRHIVEQAIKELHRPLIPDIEETVASGHDHAGDQETCPMVMPILILLMFHIERTGQAVAFYALSRNAGAIYPVPDVHHQ